MRRAAHRSLAALVACLAVVAAAAEPAFDVGVGIDGHYRAGSWTPLVVTGAGPDHVLRVAVPDPDGTFVRSPPARCNEAGARFDVRFGRPSGRVVIENASTGAAAEVDLPPPLPATAEVLLLVGDLPSLGRAARLIAGAGERRPTVIAAAPDGTRGAGAAAAAARDFDGIDTVVVCGRALGSVEPDVLAGIDAWLRDGGRLVLAAGASAAELATRGGPAAGWLPGAVANVVRLRHMTAIEAHARAAGLAERPAAADLRVPVLANRASLAGTVELFEGTLATDLPLVVRRSYGFGSIIWIGLDLDAEPFRGWPGTDTLLVRVLGGRPADEEAAPSATGAAGPPDLAGQLRLALEAPSTAAGITPVPFGVIAGLGLLYVACMFPLDWWLVSRSGRPWLAWLTLPALVAAFTGVAWATAGQWRPVSAPQMRFAEIVDVDAANETIRGRAWLAVWRRGNAAIDVAMSSDEPGSRDAALSWWADAGTGFGAIDAAVPHPTLAAADYAYADTLAALEDVPVAAVSTRLFEAGWSGTTGGTVTADLVRDGQGTLRGSFTHHLPFALVGCRLAHGGWAYDVGDLAPGEPHDLASGRGPRSLAGVLARRETVREREATARWDRGSTDLDRILEVAGFHAAAGGSAYTGLEAGRLARLDLSPLLPLDRAVLVGTAADPPPGWTTPWRVGDAGADAAATPPCAARLYRIVIPLSAPAAVRPAGSGAE